MVTLYDVAYVIGSISTLAVFPQWTAGTFSKRKRKALEEETNDEPFPKRDRSTATLGTRHLSNFFFLFAKTFLAITEPHRLESY